MAANRKCDHCGQEVPRDSRICPYCGRAQVTTPIVPRAPRTAQSLRNASKLLLAAAAAAVVMTMFAQRFGSSTSMVERPQARLEIYGRSGPRGLELVNHEPDALSACVIKLQGDWRAMIQTLQPKEVRLVTWAEFRGPAGQEMPSPAGERARYATVTCDSHREKRRAAALAFR